MADDYSELQTEVAAALNRQNLSALIPGFINAGLARANAQLGAAGGIVDQEQEAYEVLAAGVDTVALPSDFQYLRYFRIGTDPLEGAPSFDALIDEYGDDTGTPEKYTLFAGALRLRPIPSAQVTLRIGYLKRYQPFANPQDYNWLLTYGGNLLLYAACMEAAPWLKDDGRVGTWGAAYQQTLQRILDESGRSRRMPKAANVIHDPALLVIGTGGSASILNGP